MHWPSNYGAVLQTYALQHHLQGDGLDTSIVDYTPEYVRESGSLWYVGNERVRKNLLLRLAYLTVLVPLRIRQRKVFSAFRAKELCLTAPVTQADLLSEGKVRSDCYFCGSDQIWNEKNATLSDPVYFLQFAGGGVNASRTRQAAPLPPLSASA